ncbi:MAG: hypothetical protein NZM35_00200 [Chitinophagales bacterium]|nr:hypothetical protein [Chitinophagales bacterium]MDW8417866.1 hypothetical protein [Chitinophagales bacterium]
MTRIIRQSENNGKGLLLSLEKHGDDFCVVLQAVPVSILSGIALHCRADDPALSDESLQYQPPLHRILWFKSYREAVPVYEHARKKFIE